MRKHSVRLKLAAIGWIVFSAAALPASEAETNFAELQKQKQALSQAKAAQRKLLASAHAALDRAEYEAAIETHKKAAVLRREITELDQKLAACIDESVKKILVVLSDDDFNTRERGSLLLLKLGKRAAPIIAKAAETKDPEIKLRLENVLLKLADSTEDEDGTLRQWASKANASSEYSQPGWSAMQATGKPDTFNNGDAQSAWAPKDQDGGGEWIELTYNQAVRPTAVRVHETFNPGAVVKIEAQDEKAAWHTIWSGKDETKDVPWWLEARLSVPEWTTRTLKITLDTALVPGWNEIDAVELIGETDN